MVSLIDTHNHLDAPSFDADRELLVREAKDAGVIDALICSGIPSTWEKTRAVAHQVAWHYALGVHPLYINEVSDSDALLRDLTERIEALLSDNLFAAVGEIGLDGFVPGLNAEKMLTLFRGQLKIAARFDLPISVHTRHCVDTVSRELARHRPIGGVVHAFNGSVEQAKRLVGLGMKLGFGVHGKPAHPARFHRAFGHGFCSGNRCSGYAGSTSSHGERYAYARKRHNACFRVCRYTTRYRFGNSGLPCNAKRTRGVSENAFRENALGRFLRIMSGKFQGVPL